METATEMGQQQNGAPPAPPAEQSAPTREPRIVRESFIERIRVPLTDTQKLALHETGRLIRERMREREDEMKSEAKAAREDIAEMEGRVAEIDANITKGAEVELECFEEHCYATNEARVICKETSEIVSTRTLTSAELQTAFDYEQQQAGFKAGARVIDVCDAGGVVIGWDDEEAVRELLSEMKVEDVAGLAALPLEDIDAARARLVPVRWDDKGGVTLEEHNALRPEPAKTGNGASKVIAVLDGLVCEVCGDPSPSLSETTVPGKTATNEEGVEYHPTVKACPECIRKASDPHDSAHSEEDDPEAKALEAAANEARAQRDDEPTKTTSTKKNGRRKP